MDWKSSDTSCRELPNTGRIDCHMLHYVRYSISDYAIIPLMDLLGLDDSARLNTPGTVGSPNREWRLEDLAALDPCRITIERMLRYAKRGKSASGQR